MQILVLQRKIRGAGVKDDLQRSLFFGGGRRRRKQLHVLLALGFVFLNGVQLFLDLLLVIQNEHVARVARGFQQPDGPIIGLFQFGHTVVGETVNLVLEFGQALNA